MKKKTMLKYVLGKFLSNSTFSIIKFTALFTIAQCSRKSDGVLTNQACGLHGTNLARVATKWPLSHIV